MDISYYLDILPYILEGLKTTLIVFVYTIVFSIPLGIMLGSVQSLQIPILRQFISAYTWIFRGTPLLLQLYFGMYGLPAVGVVFDRMTVAILIFVLNYGAYITEIIRGSILSIDKGQTEVSKTLGLSGFQTFIFILIPQGLKRSIQAITNEIITLIKDTALVAAIALNDLLRNAKEIVSRDFRVEAFILVGVIYIVLAFIVVNISKRVEKQFAFFR